ncbi:MAG: hypothetical protein ACRELB_15940, partial [Polyangiaceae bacterium]
LVLHKGRDAFEVPFDAVESYSDGAFLGITTRSDESFDFGLGGVANASDLFRRLREEVVVRRLVPELLREIAAGEVAELRGGEPSGSEEEGDGAGYTLDAGGITVVASQRRVAWGDVVECGSAQAVSGSGRRARSVRCVVIRTKTDTIQAAVEPASDREAMQLVCEALRAKGPGDAAAS